MPKAKTLDLFNPKDTEFTAKFLLAAAAGEGIVLQRTGVDTLKSEKASYSLLPALNVGGGILRLVVNKPSALTGGERPAWIAVVEQTSEVHLLSATAFIEKLAEATVSPHPGLKGYDSPSCIRVEMSIEWATYMGIIRKTFTGKQDGKSFEQLRRCNLVEAERFVHLHNHSIFSMLDGASTIEGMVDQAVANGQPGLALTDHGFMFGTWKFYTECKKRGIAPVLGCEFYLVDDVAQRYSHEGKDRRFEYHQTVIAKNMVGFQNLCRLCTIACRDNFRYVPRIDHKTLFAHKEGLIVLSGCFKGPVAWHLQEFEQPIDGTTLPSWYRTDPDHSRSIMRMYREELKENYYVEVHSNDFARYMKAMPKIVQMAQEEKIPIVCASDAHYEVTEDAAFQAMLSRVSSTKVDEIGELKNKTGPYFISSREEINPVGVLTPDMFDRSVEIMERCKVEFPKGFLFPTYKHEEDPDWSAYVASKNTVSTSA